MDYVLFVRGNVSLAPNPDEVDDYMYVSAEELRGMLQEGGRRWSPWFIGIMERGGYEWWDDLDAALTPGGPFVDKSIDFFDPPSEHVAAYHLPSHGRLTGVAMGVTRGVTTRAPRARARAAR